MHQTVSCTQRHPRQILSSPSALYGMMIRICSAYHLEEILPLRSQGIRFRLSSRFKPVGIIKKSSGITTCRTSTSQIYPVEQRISSFLLYDCLSFNSHALQIWKWCFPRGTSVSRWSTGWSRLPFCNALHWCAPTFPKKDHILDTVYRIGAWIPTIWRPVVAINAYDLPTYNIDLTPFVPLLADGNNHTITLDISSDEPDHCGSWFTADSRLGRLIWCSCWT